MKKMGGLQGILGMLPGLAKMKAQMADRVKAMSRGGPKKSQQMAAMRGGLGGGGMGGPDMARLKAMGGGKMPEPSADELKADQERLAGLGGGQCPGGLPGLPGFPPKK
jgi:signal recognition particle subunit SRP54